MSKLQVITREIQSPATVNALARALGYSDTNDSNAINEAKRYAQSVLTTIEGDPKLQDLEPRSIVLTMVDAAKFRIEIDGRKLAYIVPYGGKATMQISYKGFLAKIKEHYPDMDYTVGMVYDGDEFSVSDKDGYQAYTHVPKDAFNQTDKGLKGIFVCLSWSENGQKCKKVMVVPKADLDKMQKKSKGGNWSDWYSQMAIKSAIKRACKVHFASISTLADIAEYDNKQNFDLKSDTILDKGKPSPIDNINAVLEKNIIDIEPTPTETTSEEEPEIVIED